MDYRKEWFRNGILDILGETDPALFNNFLEKNDNEVGIQFNSFLKDTSEMVIDISKQIFVAYKTYYSKMVEEVVEVQEEVMKQSSSSAFGKGDDKKKDKRGKKKKKGKKSIKIDNEDENEDEYVQLEASTFDPDMMEIEEDNRKGKKKNKKFGKSGGRSSPFTMMENMPQGEYRRKSQTSVSYVTVKKKIQKVVQVPQLQAYFGIIDGDSFNPENCYIYFIKKFNRPIPEFGSQEEADEKMPSFFIIGNMTGNIFENMEQILRLIFVPLLESRISKLITGNKEEDEMKEKNLELNSVILDHKYSYYFFKKHVESFHMPKELPLKSDSVYAEQLKNLICPDSDKMWQNLLDELMNLISTLKWAQAELRAEKQFFIPNSFNEIDWDNFNLNEEIELNAKEAIEIWFNKIDSNFVEVSNEELSKRNLLNEYEYWKKVETNLSPMIDELNSMSIKQVANILKINYWQIYNDFQTKRCRLFQIFTIAKENTAVLSTLSYFFKILIDGDFKIITKIIPSLIELLQSIWISSDYYSQEKNMERILLKIKNTLCHRVKSTFDVTTLFKFEWNEINDKLECVICMLGIWQFSYLKVRAHIESIRDYFIPRWEFNKIKLFSETDYIGTVIQDIKNIFKIIHHYKNLFDSKLKKLAGDTLEFKYLEEKVTSLPSPIEKVDFDIYLEIFKDEWQEILEIFEKSVVEFDQRLKLLMIKTFSQVNSIIEGIEVVEDILKIETRSTIHDSISYVCNKLIAYFANEVKLTDQTFDTNTFNTCATIYEFITWGRDLLKNLHSTFVKLKTISSLVTTSLFAEVSDEFNRLNTKIEQCIEEEYIDWCRRSKILVQEMLKENIIELEEADKLYEIKRPSKTYESKLSDHLKNESVSQHQIEDKESFGSLALTLTWIVKCKLDIDSSLKEAKTLKKVEQAHKMSWQEFVGNSLLIEKGFKFKIKLRNEIFDLVKDAEKLKDEFQLPKEILEFLAIKNQVFTQIKNIKEVISDFNFLIDSLDSSKLLFLKQYLLETEMIIQPGLTLYTWKCTVLETYCEKTSQKLRQLSCLIYQMKQIFQKLDAFIIMIENTNLLPLRNMESDSIQCLDFFQNIDDLQIKKIEDCLNTYKMISLALIQLESLILYTNTGRSSLMTSFYKEYNDKILVVLKRSILRNILDLEMLFKGQLSAHFSIKSYLENGEVVLRPTCDDLYKFVQRALDRMFDRLKWLKEWENGSCIVKKECQQFFYRSLLEDADIKERRILALKNLQVLNNALMASASSWLKYSVLWEDDKDASITQFSSNAPSLSDYEFKFDYYSNMMNVIEKEKRIVNLFCVNIEVEKLINQLKNHCIEWKDKLGIQLALHTKQTIDDVAETIQKLKSTLNIKIANYKDLIDVLMCINDIEQIEIDVLIKFYKIKEHYHELSIRNFKMCIEDLDRFNRLQIEWENIYDTSLLKKFMLEPTKIIVADTMKTRIVKFGEECRAFVSRYKEDKLKLEYLNFNSCIELILDYAQQYSRLYEKKEELLKIHNCFEIMLPIKFDDFTNMKTELEDVKSKFKILDEID